MTWSQSDFNFLKSVRNIQEHEYKRINSQKSNTSKSAIPLPQTQIQCPHSINSSWSGVWQI
jgi:hypothetical protein